MTLREAAARFHALARTEPGFNWAEFRRANPGCTEEERFGRSVIGWVEMTVEEPAR